MELGQAVQRYNYQQLQSPAAIELSEEQLKKLVEELASYPTLYHRYFRHEEQIEKSYHYLVGLVKPNRERKSSENIALSTLGIEGVRPMQNFIGQSRWECEGILQEHCRQIGKWLGDENGVLIIDGSDFPKQGEESVGVKRQWCGEVGKTANCQAGVFIGYCSRQGYSLLNRRLYLPAEWFTAEYANKRYKTGVPATVTFQTKNELAWQMIEQVQQAATLPVRWLTMEEAFGRDTHLLDQIANQTPYFYFAEVPKDTMVWLTRPKTYQPAWTGIGRPPTKLRLLEGEPASLSLEAVVASFTQHDWHCHSLKEGSKGFIFAYLAARRIVAVREGLPGPDLWLIVRRTPFDPSDLKFFLSNAPPHTSLDDFAIVCALRWPIETIFEFAKQHLGLNEYETRSWLGWHHHLTLVILAFGFLARSHLLLKQHANSLTLPQLLFLLASLLPQQHFSPTEALMLLRYKQMRIASAKRSHYLLQKRRSLDPLFATQ